MAWATPRTWVAAETVDEDMMNEQVRDNISYLKTVADKHDDCVMRDGTTVAYVSPSGTRVKDTIYQNTSGKTRFVLINCSGAALQDELDIYIGAASPPNIMVDGYIAPADNPTTACGSLTFTVPSNYYYKAIEQNATITINKWTEWDIL